MKKILIVLSSLFLTYNLQAQMIPQPKPGTPPSIKIGKPVTFELQNGLKVLVVENHKLPRVSFNLTLDNAPYAEGDKKGVSDLTGILLGNGSVKTSKDAFNEEIDFMGANINFRSNGASASSLSKYSGRVLELLTEAVLNPNFSQEEFDKQKSKFIEGLKSQEKSVSAVAQRVGDALPFGKNHPGGEYITEKSLTNITLNDVKLNYQSYFVPANAYLVIVGDVKTKETQKVVEKLFATWTKATAPALSYSDPKNVQYTQINFVDMPNAVQSEVSAVNLVNLKMSDPDYFATIVANQILGGDFNSYLNMNLREAHAWTYGARSSIRGDKNITKFEASTQVRNAVTDSTVVEILKEFKKIRTEKVSEEVLTNVKAGYIGKFVMQVEKPQTVASYALRIKTQGLSEDFYQNYIKSINAVTADDVLRVANTYFMADNLRIIIVGKGTEVVPALEKLKMPMFFFDKYGNPTEKPVMKKATPAGVTTSSVLDSYINAIGGAKAVSAIKTIYTTSTATIPQAPAPITLVSKKDVKGNSFSEMSIQGMGSMSKSVVTNKMGYSVQQGQRKDLTGAELADKQASATTFEELLLLKKTDLILDGIETINGNDAYAIKNGKTTLYYDVKSGLKILEATDVQQGDKKLTITKEYKDYKTIGNVKFPHEVILNQGFEIDFKVSEIKINEGVSDKDFE